MEFSVTETIAAARAQVLDALVDPEYYTHLGETSTAVRAPELLAASVNGGVITTEVRYAFDGTISGPAAMVVDSDKLTWVIVTTYDTSADTGTVVVVPDHYQGMLACSGTLALEEADGSTLQILAGRLEVKVPLVSGSAEKAIYGGFTRHLKMEAEAMAAYCATRP